VVSVSHAHLVFLAVHCILKRANLLQFVPFNLLVYMEHITNLNRKRNQEIIIQAKEINALLKANKIASIFLKGARNLLVELYEDIAERM
jgi:hypothetical protein